MRIVLALCCLAMVSGCATIYQTDNTVMAEGFNYVYKDYVVEITSDPSGAKIDWNGTYIGTTPLQQVLNGHRGMAAPVVITAHAVAPGQGCETKVFSGTGPLPRQIHFN